MDPRALLHEDEPRFIWSVGRFKNLTAETEAQRAALLSYGTSLAQAVLEVAPPTVPIDLGAAALRRTLLQSKPVIELGDLVTLCWAVGIPVLYLRVFPLEAKHLCAMAIPIRQRYAILLARDTRYPAQAAFYLAHEIGHVALGHLTSGAIVDLEDPLQNDDDDEEETAANRYALELLTGEPEPSVVPKAKNYTGKSLADSAIAAAAEVNIDAGTLVLCFAHETGRWDKAMVALKIIYGAGAAIPDAVNTAALGQLDLNALPDDTSEFILGALGRP